MTILFQKHSAHLPLNSRAGEDFAAEQPFLVKVPAKAMLFGEYGVLFGGVALAAVLPERTFELEASLKKALRGSLSVVEFHSELAGGRLQLCLADWADSFLNTAAAGEDPVKLFLLRALAPLLPLLSQVAERGFLLKLRVKSAFSPSLGLGSSSALIVSLYRAVNHLYGLIDEKHQGLEKVFSAKVSDVVSLAQCVPHPWELELKKAWPMLFKMLKSAQGPGSGYDIAAQFAASSIYKLFEAESDLKSGTKTQGLIFAFRQSSDPEQSCLLSEVKANWFWKNSGFLIPSGKAAPTGVVLKAALKNTIEASEGSGTERPIERLKKFAEAHAQIACEAAEILADESCWANATARHPFAAIFRRSLEVATQQGIAGHLHAMDLPTHGLVYKTMGAGLGDSIWCVPEYVSGKAECENRAGGCVPHKYQGVALELK